MVDVSSLTEFGSSIHVRDIKLSDKIRVLTDLDEIVAIVTAPEVEEEEVVEEVVEGEPEVIEKGKKEEEEEF
jgi:large subunit ribosomal protein L25